MVQRAAGRELPEKGDRLGLVLQPKIGGKRGKKRRRGFLKLRTRISGVCGAIPEEGARGCRRAPGPLPGVGQGAEVSAVSAG